MFAEAVTGHDTKWSMGKAEERARKRSNRDKVTPYIFLLRWGDAVPFRDIRSYKEGYKYVDTDTYEGKGSLGHQGQCDCAGLRTNPSDKGPDWQRTERPKFHFRRDPNENNVRS